MNDSSLKIKTKTSISVPEMYKLLGISKVEGYWLVKKNCFKTITAAGQLRVMLDSFEDWYAEQFHYKKVHGEAPGSKWTESTMSVLETIQLLGISDTTLYTLMKKKPFRTYKIDNRTRIDRVDFNRWYHSQSFYRTVEDQQKDQEKYQDTLTLPEISRMLGIHRNTVYVMVKTGKFTVIDTGGKKCVPKVIFENWYQSQSHYKKIGGDESGINH